MLLGVSNSSEFGEPVGDDWAVSCCCLPRSRFGPALWLDSTTTATALGP